MGSQSIFNSRAARILQAGSAAAILLAASPEAAAPRSDAKPAERRICRVVTPTGSRLTARVCRTQAEWDRRSESAQREALDQQLSGTAPYGREPAPR